MVNCDHFSCSRSILTPFYVYHITIDITVRYSIYDITVEQFTGRQKTAHFRESLARKTAHFADYGAISGIVARLPVFLFVFK